VKAGDVILAKGLLAGLSVASGAALAVAELASLDPGLALAILRDIPGEVAWHWRRFDRLWEEARRMRP
jgi:hypothetical protein